MRYEVRKSEGSISIKDLEVGKFYLARGVVWSSERGEEPSEHLVFVVSPLDYEQTKLLVNVSTGFIAPFGNLFKFELIGAGSELRLLL